MNAHDYRQQKLVTESEPNTRLTLVMRFTVLSLRNCCWNCESYSNVYVMPSEPWTRAQYCQQCNSVNFAVLADRMSGVHTDTVSVYR